MSLWKVFLWPLAIGLLTIVGLLAGLTSDDWGDALAALGLAVPAWIALRQLWAKGARP